MGDAAAVVARRLGTVCPKMIDYLNFVKPWDAEYRHDTATNVKQLQAWRKLYKESTATAPSCWPGKIKHDGHTISVSDVWFIGHHLGKMSTLVGHLDHLEEDSSTQRQFLQVPSQRIPAGRTPVQYEEL